MGRIVAIGGGQVWKPCQLPETWAIDQEIVRLARESLPEGRERPNILFIPTASLGEPDDLGYCNTIYVIYELRLGCRYDHLRFRAEALSNDEIQSKIEWADIIYVGGGNTLRMMYEWKNRGVDKLLREAYNRDVILCGLSAGAICWFDWGLSDSLKETSPKDWFPIKAEGLGLFPYAMCPHYDSEGEWRKPAMRMMISDTDQVGIALEDLTAIEIVDGTYRIITARDDAHAYLLYEHDGRYWKDRIFSQHKKFYPLSHLSRPR